MGCLSKDTIKRLFLLYLIGKFEDGVYGNFKFQKVLYFALKDTSKRLFTFKHTDLGQFSSDAQYMLEQLASMGYIKVTELPIASDSGNRWVLIDKSVTENYRIILKNYSEELISLVDNSIEKYGYMNWQKLKKIAHNDPDMLKTELFNIIFKENLPETLEINLPYEECEDLELSLNPHFVASMTGLIKGVESGKISIEQLRKIE